MIDRAKQQLYAIGREVHERLALAEPPHPVALRGGVPRRQPRRSLSDALSASPSKRELERLEDMDDSVFDALDEAVASYDEPPDQTD